MSVTSKELVNTSKGTLDRRIYTDQKVYARELEQVFGRCWLFVGHESQIRNNNDFAANYMGEDPVLVARDSKGKLHTFNWIQCIDAGRTFTGGRIPLSQTMGLGHDSKSELLPGTISTRIGEENQRLFTIDGLK